MRLSSYALYAAWAPRGEGDIPSTPRPSSTEFGVGYEANRPPRGGLQQ
jgi:hypothetical protein